MNPSCGLTLQPSQPAAAPIPKKRGGGLLSRLFSSLPSDRRVEASSATPKSQTSSSWPAQCPAALSHQVGTSSAAVMSTIPPSFGQTGYASTNEAPFFNYKMNISEKYDFGRELGKGGNGVVRVVTDRETGEEFACKSIPKVLKDASEKKKEGHLASIRREVQVLSKLRGSLNVAKLEDVYEDEDNVHLVMEICTGGELWHRVGERHYSERTVASFMRAVLRTLAQCHAQNILHRDIKPGNFMLLSGDERAPVRAIDFGLAAPFEPQQLPRTDLGLEGTPWYMAPETLRGEWSPASDMWAAGVMAYQLLSGRFPFDDKRNSYAPAMTAIWRSVLSDSLDFPASRWSALSEEARDFCRLLLNRDVAARPSAREALKHPWLRGDSSERSVGKKLSRSVVARIQRFSSGSLLRRSVLKSIAAELLSHPELLASTPAAAAAGEHAACGSGGKGDAAPGRGWSKDQRRDQAPEAVADAGDDVGGNGSVGGAVPEAAALGRVLSQLRLEGAEATLNEAQLGEALARMGFRLAPSEVSRLMTGLDTSGRGAVGRSAVAASLLDWRQVQRNHKELWLELAAKAFRQLDSDSSGVLEVDELISALRARLPPAEEVREALEEALREAEAGGVVGTGAVGLGLGLGAEQGMDFEAFVNFLKVGSHDSLDMYDDRLSIRSGCSKGGSLDRYNTLLAASSYHRAGGLATSCSTNDWSRHGPGSSRHGAGGHVYGAGGCDISTHSCTSDRSDVASVPDNDRSQHGVGVQSVPQSLNRYPAATAVQSAGAIAFRFETDRTDRSTATTTSSNRFATASASANTANAAEGTTSAGAGGMVWRFDVGGSKAPPPPPPPPVWRFDVGGGSGGKSSWEPTATPAASTAAMHMVAVAAAGTAAAATAAAAAASGSGSGSGLSTGGGTTLNGLPVRQQGGYFDRRMHGSNLYRNVALRALQGGGFAGVSAHRGSCLDTVAE